MPKIFVSIAVLPLALMLGGCPGQKLKTATTATGDIPRVCKVWESGPYVSFASKHDTPETVDSARIVNRWMDVNNARRGSYCTAK